MKINTLDVGLIEFKKACNLQKKIIQEVKSKNTPSTLILCEHYPVITCGRKFDPRNILTDKETLTRLDIQVCNVDRGGDVTYHGPGQLVIYPVIDLNEFKKDITLYLRILEDICIDFLHCYNIKSGYKDSLRGVWARDKKIASIGIAIKNWITYHGIAININVDLNRFLLIKPCGQNIKMTSMQKILNKTIDIKKSKLIIIDKFNKYFLRKNLSKNETHNLTRTW